MLEIDPISKQVAAAFTEDEHGQFLIKLAYQANMLGHVCLPIDLLAQDMKELVKEAIIKCPKDLIATNQEEFVKPLYFSMNCLYIHKSFRAEETFFNELLRYLSTFEAQSPLAFEEDQSLSFCQNEALRLAHQTGMLLLTGGPGTGKTYTAKTIASKIIKQSNDKTIILTAPTAKALEQLKKSIGLIPDAEVISMTLHKLVEFRLNKPSYVNAGCIIVDEASMIDAPLMAKLFESLGSKAKLIMMGDPNQLPSVGFGSFFQDLIESKDSFKFLHHAHLQEIHRCQNPSLIKLAELVKEANYDEFSTFIKMKNHDFDLISAPLQSLDKISLDVFTSFFSQTKFDYDDLNEAFLSYPRDIVLSTLRQGPLGVDQINKELSHYYFYNSSKRFYVEPIMIIENSKEMDLFNGEIGYKIYDRLSKTAVLSIKNKRIPVSSDIKTLPAFAISVHKSQGSEYERVLFMAPKGSEKFSREIIYTAVTRVKRKLFLWLDEDPVKIALEKKNQRYSGLAYRLKAIQS